MLASSTLQEILLSRKIRILVYTTLLLLLLYLKCQVWENSYKSEKDLRYVTRYLAKKCNS